MKCLGRLRCPRQDRQGPPPRTDRSISHSRHLPAPAQNGFDLPNPDPAADPRPPHGRSHAELRVARKDPRLPHVRSHADLRNVRQGPHHSSLRFHPDDRGFVCAISGSEPAAMASIPHFRGAGSAPWRAIGPDGAWDHPWRPGRRSASRRRRPFGGWGETVPNPIARLRQIHQSNYQRTCWSQSTVLKPGTGPAKRKPCRRVFGMIRCDERDGSDADGDAGRRGGGSADLRRLTGDWFDRCRVGETHRHMAGEFGGFYPPYEIRRGPSGTDSKRSVTPPVRAWVGRIGGGTRILGGDGSDGLEGHAPSRVARACAVAGRARPKHGLKTVVSPVVFTEESPPFGTSEASRRGLRDASHTSSLKSYVWGNRVGIPGRFDLPR